MASLSFAWQPSVWMLTQSMKTQRSLNESKAGLSRVHGVHRSIVLKHETSTFAKVTLYQLISISAWVITLGRSPTLTKLVRVRWAVETPRGATYTGTVTFCMLFLIFFYSLTELQPIPVNQFNAHNSSKAAVWGIGRPFWGCEMYSCENLRVFNPKKPLKWSGVCNYHPKNVEYLRKGKIYTKL